MADDANTIQISVVPTLDLKQFERSFGEFKRRMDHMFVSRKASPGITESMFFPRGRAARTSVSRTIKQNMSVMTQEFSKGLKGISSDSGVRRGFSTIESGFQRITAAANAATDAVSRLNAVLSGMGGAGGRGGGPGRPGGGGAGGWGREDEEKESWWDRLKGKWYTRAAAWGGGAITKGMWQFATEAYGEGIKAFEATQTARLMAAPGLMPMRGGRGAKFPNLYRSGLRMGFTAAEAAGIQAQGARAGLGRGAAGAQAAFELTRALGAEGAELGGGIMRRGGLRGATGVNQMMKTLSKSFTVAVKTGLDEARVPEFLSAANKYAEEQIAITPDKRDFITFSRELARVQMGGGAGMMGKYGAQALMRVDKAMKGATGVQQAFLMRSFGFGQGANFLDVLRRQEQGLAGAGPGGKTNMTAVMEQLRREYGAGRFGGLSSQALLAFKGMGFGSTFMGQKFGEIYLQQKAGKLSPEEAQKKVQDVMAKEAEAKMPRIQVRAYQAMANWGGVAKTLASRFDFMAGKGGQWYELKRLLHEAQRTMVKSVDPMIKAFTKGFKSLVPVIKKLAPKIGSILAAMVRGLTALGKGIGTLTNAVINLTRAIHRILFPFGSKELSKRLTAQSARAGKNIHSLMHRKHLSNVASRLGDYSATEMGRKQLGEEASLMFKRYSGLRKRIGRFYGLYGGPNEVTDKTMISHLFGSKVASKLSETQSSNILNVYASFLGALEGLAKSNKEDRQQFISTIQGYIAELKKLGVNVSIVSRSGPASRRQSAKQVR